MDIVTNKKLNKIELRRLSNFLKEYCDCSVIELHGFFTAIISGPSLIMPSEWMEVVGIADMEFKSEHEAKTILSGVMSLYNTIATQFQKQTYTPLITLEKLETLEEMTIAAETWAHGYIRGIELDADSWMEIDGDELPTLLFPILSLIISDEDLQEELVANNSDNTPNDLRRTGVELLPNLTNAINQFWLEHNQTTSPMSPSEQPYGKIGRNDPCPCDSGKKYKKCCQNEVLH